MNTIDTVFAQPVIGLLRQLPNANDIYLVGGSVRDAFLGRTVKDLDFACKEGIQTGRELANRNGMDFFILDRERDCCRVIQTLEDGSKLHFDINGLRAPTIENDLQDRDLTINALAINIVTQKLNDPTGGLQDIRNKILRACSESSIRNDPLRALRVIRFSVIFGFRIDPSLVSQIRAQILDIANISNERIRDEFFKLLNCSKPATAIDLMEKLGLLGEIFPELNGLKGLEQPKPHVYDAWTHTLSVVRHLSNILEAASKYDEENANADLFTGMLVLKLGNYRKQLVQHFSSERSDGRDRRANLLFTALFHDVEKPTCKTNEDGRIRFLGHDAAGALTMQRLATELRLSTDEKGSQAAIVANHMWIHGLVNRMDDGVKVSERAIYRYYRSLGLDGIDLVFLSLADLRATYEHTLTQQKWRNALDVSEQLLDAWYNRKEQVISPPVLVNGHTLMKELGLQPGKILGKLIESVREDQAAGKIKTLDEALAHCREKYAELRAKDIQN